MKCFQILGVVLVASSALAQLNTYSTLSSSSIGLTHAAPVSYGVAAAAPISYGIAAAAPVSYGIAAAAPVSYGITAAAPVASYVAAAAPVVSAAAPSVRSHEIHTGGAANTIRVEEHRAAGQVIRVHDSPQSPAQVINVQGPAAAADHIRLVSRSGPTQVQRQVYQNPNAQVYDVVNPPKPSDQIINIRGAPAPPARVELIADQQHAAPEIHVGGNDVPTQVVHAGPAPALAASAISYAAPAISTIHAAPAISTIHAAPAVSTIHAAPAVSYAAAPAVSYAAVPAVSYAAAPAISYAAAPAISALGYRYGQASTYGSTAVLHKA